MEPGNQRPTKDNIQYSPSKPRAQETPPIIRAPTPNRSPAQNVCIVLGVVFILLGLAGFVLPSLADFHLSPTHNAIHLISGILGIWFGSGKSILAAKNFCWVLGTIYLLLGLGGFVFGAGTADSLVRPIPNVLEFGTTDHLLHLAFGLIFLVGAYRTLRGPQKRAVYH